MAKDSKRWLLVNLQRNNEFSCHALNRDVWRDELVENLIGEGFIFWQEVRKHVYREVYYETFDLIISFIEPITAIMIYSLLYFPITNHYHRFHLVTLDTALSVAFFVVVFLWLLLRWTLPKKVLCMQNDTRFTIILICF